MGSRRIVIFLNVSKGQTKSKRFFQADVSSKKQRKEFNFTTMRLVFVRFLEEIEDTKKAFRNELNFIKKLKSRILKMRIQKYLGHNIERPHCSSLELIGGHWDSGSTNLEQAFLSFCLGLRWKKKVYRQKISSST